MVVTIKDIAKQARVSHTTVSRALNDSPHIKLETKREIMALAEEMGYTPNYSAKSLVTRKSYTIGLFFSTISQGTSASFFAATINGITANLTDNYNLFIRGLDNYQDYQAITAQRFDGIIVMSQSETDDAFITHVNKRGIPLIVLNREVSVPGAVNILSADREGARLAVKSLIAVGHKQVALIQGKMSFKSSQERERGYRLALAEAGLPVHSSYIAAGEYTMQSGYRAMQQLLALPNRPTAVFCSNDDMAIGAIRAANEQQLVIPADISIIGFDNIDFAAFTIPQLSTVQRPIAEISKLAAEIMLRLIDQKYTATDPIFVKTTLVMRDSIMAPKV